MIAYAFIVPLAFELPQEYLLAFNEHPIIAPKESQRNPGNLAAFGIKNARRSAGQHKLVLRSGINQFSPTARRFGC